MNSVERTSVYDQKYALFFMNSLQIYINEGSIVHIFDHKSRIETLEMLGYQPYNFLNEEYIFYNLLYN